MSSFRFIHALGALLVLTALLGCESSSSPDCVIDDDCNDGVFCNGAERCADGTCVAGAPVDPDDDVACTHDACDEAVAGVVNTPADDLCETGDVCNPTAGCTNPPDGCAFREAEHPSFTTVNRDVVLCGNQYTPEDIDDACGAGWHVCLLAEWSDRFPSGVWPEGARSTWGADQSVRCAGGVWEANRPSDDEIWPHDVCEDAYNPWNQGKFLYDDDGATILEGDGSCCSWDTSFEPTSLELEFAVYCCRD